MAHEWKSVKNIRTRRFITNRVGGVDRFDEPYIESENRAIEFMEARSDLSGHELFPPNGCFSWEEHAESGMAYEDRRPFRPGHDDGDAWFKPAPSDAICTTSVSSNNVRAKELGLVGDLTMAQWGEIRTYTGCRCVYCGAPKSGVLEHFVPIYLGGGTTISNVVLSCKRCNDKKNRIHPDKFIAKLPNGEERRAYILGLFQYMKDKYAPDLAR